MCFFYRIEIYHIFVVSDYDTLIKKQFALNAKEPLFFIKSNHKTQMTIGIPIRQLGNLLLTNYDYETGVCVLYIEEPC